MFRRSTYFAHLTTLLGLCLAVPAAPASDSVTPVRVASFNIAMGLKSEGELARRLQAGDDPGLHALAAILRSQRPDLVLLNEFDYQDSGAGPGLPVVQWLNDNYLAAAAGEGEPIRYAYAWSAPVNTGLDSGLDLNQDGRLHGPADAWGFGFFPGQYGMLLLSRFPIEDNAVRTFQQFLWRDLPGAAPPLNTDGSAWYPEPVWKVLRLSSKSHWDVPVRVSAEQVLHVLASHPTPPVFDGPEDRHGARNRDEIGFWVNYLGSGDTTSPADATAQALYDDAGHYGGLAVGANFVLLGDLNADSVDGDNLPGGIDRLLSHPRINRSCTPASAGGIAAALAQGGANAIQKGNPTHDTADFDDRVAGNLRADYALAASQLHVSACGVYWPAPGEPGAEWIAFSDHRLVWLDLQWPETPAPSELPRLDSSSADSSPDSTP